MTYRIVSGSCLVTTTSNRQLACLLSSLKDAAIFLRDNEELFVSKVKGGEEDSFDNTVACSARGRTRSCHPRPGGVKPIFARPRVSQQPGGVKLYVCARRRVSQRPGGVKLYVCARRRVSRRSQVRDGRAVSNCTCACDGVTRPRRSRLCLSLSLSLWTACLALSAACLSLSAASLSLRSSP